MSINLETRAEVLETEPRTADSRSFFIVAEQPVETGLGVEETAEQTLFERTQTIHAWEPELGYPAFMITSPEGKNQAMISTGTDLDDDTAVWQINVFDGRTILHGQTTESGDRWQWVRKDHQGRLWQETTLWDRESPGLLSSFVIGAINKVGNLAVIADSLIETRRAKKLEYESCQDKPGENGGSAYWGTRQKDLLRACSVFKFAAHDAISLQPMIEPNKDNYCRWQNIGCLPDIVMKLLINTNYEVALLGTQSKKAK